LGLVLRGASSTGGAPQPFVRRTPSPGCPGCRTDGAPPIAGYTCWSI